jgi:hypothetical protein
MTYTPEVLQLTYIVVFVPLYFQLRYDTMRSFFTSSWFPLKPLVTMLPLSIVLVVLHQAPISVPTWLPLNLLLKLLLLLCLLLLLYVVTAN